MLHDRIALERHDFSATRAAKLQNAKHWVLRLNAHGDQKPLRVKQCLQNARRSPGGNATISDTDTSTTSTASTTKSAIRRRRKHRLLCRSENWMAVLQRATGKPASSVFIFIFIFIFAVADFAMANELELVAIYIILEVVVISVSWKEVQKIDGVCRQDTHSQHTYSAVQSVHKRGTHRTRLAQELHNIFVRLKRICHLVRTHLTLCCCLTCRLPRAHHLPHSLFPLPRHQNTHYNRDNTIYSKNTPTS